MGKNVNIAVISSNCSIKMYIVEFCRRKEEDPEERPAMGGRGHPLFGNLNPFDILQHLLKKSRSPSLVFFPQLHISGSDKKAKKKVPDSLRAYAESVSQFKAAQKREQQSQRRLSVDQSERYEPNHLAGGVGGRYPYQDYDFHNSVRRSGSGLNGNNDTMPDSAEEFNEIQENSLGNLESTESSHSEGEKDYDYEYDYEDEASDDEDEDEEKSDEGPEYYYYYYYEYPDEGIDISHEMDAGTKEPIYEPLPTPLWQKGKHINSTAESAEKSENISESK